jgi:hypothetical protein
LGELFGQENLNLNFILPPHTELFHQHVIDAYTEIDCQYPPNAFNVIPFAFVSKGSGLFVPAYLGERSSNPQYFYEITRNMSEREQGDFINDVMVDFEQQFESNIMEFGKYHYLLYQDITSVLNYYNMS